MRRKKEYPFSLKRWMTVLSISLFLATGVSPVMGLTPMPGYKVVNLSVANDAGARFDDFGNDTYNFFAATQSANQGLNALHLSSHNAANNYGDVTFTGAQSGVFYMSDTGGRGWNDDGVLMLAVNGTIPDNFRVRIRSSGYQWTPVPKDEYPPYGSLMYVNGAVDEYFTRADFMYGPQIWKPCPAQNYPLYEGQDMTDTTNMFSIMFIDLNAGNLGPAPLSSPTYAGKTVVDNGSIRIEYTFENLQTFAAFSAYSYTADSNQGRGVRWTNSDLAGSSSVAPSGYYVTGTAPAVLTLPGQANPPTDPDSDGLYEDLNGNAEMDFNDVQLFFRQMDWIAANEPIALFDFNLNGGIDFNDIQLLFRRI